MRRFLLNGKEKKEGRKVGKRGRANYTWKLQRRIEETNRGEQRGRQGHAATLLQGVKHEAASTVSSLTMATGMGDTYARNRLTGNTARNRSVPGSLSTSKKPWRRQKWRGKKKKKKKNKTATGEEGGGLASTRTKRKTRGGGGHHRWDKRNEKTPRREQEEEEERKEEEEKRQ